MPGTEVVNTCLSVIKIHLDEDADSYALLNALRHRGLDVTSTREGGLLGCLDEEHLAWANERRRVIYTYNASDFCRAQASNFLARLGIGARLSCPPTLGNRI